MFWRTKRARIARPKREVLPVPMEEPIQATDTIMGRLRAAEAEVGGHLTTEQFCDFVAEENDWLVKHLDELDAEGLEKRDAYYLDLAQFFAATKEYIQRDDAIMAEMERRWPGKAPLIISTGALLNPESGNLDSRKELMRSKSIQLSSEQWEKCDKLVNYIVSHNNHVIQLFYFQQKDGKQTSDDVKSLKLYNCPDGGGEVSKVPAMVKQCVASQLKHGKGALVAVFKENGQKKSVVNAFVFNKNQIVSAPLDKAAVSAAFPGMGAFELQRAPEI